MISASHTHTHTHTPVAGNQTPSRPASDTSSHTTTGSSPSKLPEAPPSCWQSSRTGSHVSFLSFKQRRISLRCFRSDWPVPSHRLHLISHHSLRCNKCNCTISSLPNLLSLKHYKMLFSWNYIKTLVRSTELPQMLSQLVKQLSEQKMSYCWNVKTLWVPSMHCSMNKLQDYCFAVCWLH